MLRQPNYEGVNFMIYLRIKKKQFIFYNEKDSIGCLLNS